MRVEHQPGPRIQKAIKYIGVNVKAIFRIKVRTGFQKSEGLHVGSQRSALVFSWAFTSFQGRLAFYFRIPLPNYCLAVAYHGGYVD